MRKFKLTILMVCVLTMVCSTVVYGRANGKVKDDNKESQSYNYINEPGDFGEDDTIILPPISASYPSYCTFLIDLPTGSGEGLFCTTTHYYDPDECWGYPPSIHLEMATNCTCDFTGSVWAKESFTGNYYNASGSTYQTSTFVIKRTFPDYLTMILTGVNDAGHPSYARVWDDE
ncbi:MAG: hypothetical protein ACI4EV_01305, partial [Lachnospiraceae bacterium]